MRLLSFKNQMIIHRERLPFSLAKMLISYLKSSLVQVFGVQKYNILSISNKIRQRERQEHEEII